MTPAEAARAVAVLQAAFPAARWSEATVAVYESLLSDLDAELVTRAIERIIRSSKFLPTVAEVRDAAAELAFGPGRSGLEAWAEVGLAIRRVGSYGSPTFDDPLVAECVRVLGWRTLCHGGSPEGVDRARFVELYQELLRRQRLQDVSEPGRILPPAEAEQKLLPSNVRDLVRRVGR